jgi:hypothetical protein
MVLGLGAQIGDVDRAVGTDHHDLHAGEHRRRRVGAVRRLRNQARAMRLIAGAVTRIARARVLALRARVGLQRDRAADLGEPGLELMNSAR